MSKSIKIKDQVSFSFAGSTLNGTVIEFYKNNTKALIEGEDGLKYPTDKDSLIKI